jgi:hypothetical protein
VKSGALLSAVWDDVPLVVLEQPDKETRAAARSAPPVRRNGEVIGGLENARNWAEGKRI